MLLSLVHLLLPTTVAWTAADTSRHTQRMVAVAADAQLEVLDWGGRGRPVVLLTGYGNTAHIYDDLAPRLARDFHVYGITRRGYGRSSAAPPGLTVARLADDVAAVLDSLHLDRPALVGHSLGTMELVALGIARGSRLGGLVFLDGPYEEDDPAIMAAIVAFEAFPVEPPMKASDRVSYAALQAYGLRSDGFLTPAGEYEARYLVNADGSLRRPAMRGFSLDSVWASIHFPLGLSRISTPSLAIYALWEGPIERIVPYFALLNDADKATARALHAQWTATGRDTVRMRQIERFRREVPGGQSVGISGAQHYVFLSHPDEVYQRMRKFLLELPR